MRWQFPPRWLGYGLAGLVGLALILIGLRWAYVVPSRDKSVAEQWQETISQLGIEPVYPPEEDLLVGDVFALITRDARQDVTSTPLAGRSIKLAHLDLSADLEDTYRTTYTFPDVSTHGASETGGAQNPAPEPLFKTGTVRKQLPLVIFPGFTVAHLKRANAGGNSPWAAFGANATSDDSVELRISGAETYGIPALVAEQRLVAFCSDPATKDHCTQKGARVQLSMVVGSAVYEKVHDRKSDKYTPRLAVEISLVTRVFLTRSIESRYRRGRALLVNARGSRSDTTSTESHATPDQPPAASGDASEIARLRAQLEELRKERATDNTAGAPGVETSIQAADAETISVVETLPRPVVFAFRTIRWTP